MDPLGVSRIPVETPPSSRVVNGLQSKAEGRYWGDPQSSAQAGINIPKGFGLTRRSHWSLNSTLRAKNFAEDTCPVPGSGIPHTAERMCKPSPQGIDEHFLLTSSTTEDDVNSHQSSTDLGYNAFSAITEAV